jgi:hypothetical protein
LSIDNAPVHSDVGGCVYTSSLDTLTKHPASRLSKMFNGTLPIVLDSLKQHYFIDRDGKTFRHVLNFMRTNRLVLPDNFDDFETLLDEAKFYELEAMAKQIEEFVEARKLKLNLKISNELMASHHGQASGAKMSSANAKNRYHPYDMAYEKLIDDASLSQMPKAKQTALIIRSAFKSNATVKASPRENVMLDEEQQASTPKEASRVESELLVDEKMETELKAASPSAGTGGNFVKKCFFFFQDEKLELAKKKQYI